MNKIVAVENVVTVALNKAVRRTLYQAVEGAVEGAVHTAVITAVDKAVHGTLPESVRVDVLRLLRTMGTPQ